MRRWPGPLQTAALPHKTETTRGKSRLNGGIASSFHRSAWFDSRVTQKVSVGIGQHQPHPKCFVNRSTRRFTLLGRHSANRTQYSITELSEGHFSLGV
jgi:hypothetical protein